MTVTANGRAHKSVLGDLEAARWLLRVVAGEPLPGDVEDGLDPEWADGFSTVRDWPDLGIVGWLATLKARGTGRYEAIVAALEAAESGGGPKPAYATLADAMKVIGETRWFWKDWIPIGVMSLMAGRGGEGKTRTAMHLAYILWHGLSMPDGSENPYPKGTQTLWILVDRNWQETAEVARSFGVPWEAIHLNSLKETPLTTPELDDPATIAALAGQIRELKPALVVIDTITYATSRNTAKAEEAKAAFDGLLQLAAETGVPLLALTHLNKEGEALGRRITERARSVISISCPDPEGQENRRKIWVSKSAVKRPDPLGITLREDGQDYDLDPPTEPEADRKPPGKAPTKSVKDAEWLKVHLGDEARKLCEVVEAAKVAGIITGTSLTPLYNAKQRLPLQYPGFIVEEFESPNGPGLIARAALKYWKVVLCPTQASPT